MLNEAQLQAIATHCPEATVRRVLPSLNRFLHDYGLSRRRPRVAAALAQILHECSEFRQMIEAWGPTADQKRYAGRYGNTDPEMAFRYRGRGWIQVTFPDNYRAAGEFIRTRYARIDPDEWHSLEQITFFRTLDLMANPELASQHTVSAETAGWYWTTHGLNKLADAGDLRTITKRINGAATEGPPSYFERRLAYYRRALEVLT